MDLKTPVREAGRVFKLYAKRLEKLRIETLGDFLYHVPSRYEDYSLISKIGQVQNGETVTIQGTIEEIKNEYTKNYKKLQKAKISDGTGDIEAVWFNQPFLTKYIHKGDRVSLAGKISWFSHNLVMESPDYEILTPNQSEQNTRLQSPERSNGGQAEQPITIHTGRLVPIYPETHGVSSKWLRRQVYKILKEQGQNLFEYIPDSIIKNIDLLGFNDAIEQIHFPKSHELIDKARFRLAFDELFLMQLAARERRKKWEETLEGHPFSVTEFKKNIEEFWEKLPFELTSAQKKAVSDIFKDLASKKPMNRLLEGDVGSGKTVVGAIAMYLAFLNGFQSVLMAPTEILAQQHYKTILNLLSPLGVKVELVTGSSKFQISNVKCQINTNKSHKKKDFKLEIGYWKFDILIGTHAVLSDKIKFDKLGLVIIDEQQRFGVEQRGIIRDKGKNPHLLTMTATPIPRTIALTLYGDLDLSYLDEMPQNRKKIKTWLVPKEKRQNAYKWINSQLSTFNSQLFVICPFIDESENMQTIKAATKEYEILKKEIFQGFKVGLLHGKLKGKEKDNILTKFKNREFDILVATPVVEVGIDIPNATIILIEASERFGLAQLHQLRGRVGRGDKQSYCLLFTQSSNPQTIYRLKSMERMNNGAELAELDLKLRGPGEIFGTLQHGMPELKIASFSDFKLIEKVKIEAENIFPHLSSYPNLMKKLEEITIKQVSPD